MGSLKQFLLSLFATTVSIALTFGTAAIIDYNKKPYGLASQELLSDMQHLFTQCKQMMEVTDEEIDAYRKQRQKMDKDMGDDRDSLKSKRNDLEQLNQSLLDAVKKLNLK